MTDADKEDLRALGEELSALETSPWEPICVARAFGPLRTGQIALTMQGWLELDRQRSVLLEGGLPQSVEELEQSMSVFGLALSNEITPADGALIAGEMQAAIEAAFATAVRMEPPEKGERTDQDGFGDWLSIYAFLVVQCGLSPEEALMHRVDRSFALIAGHRHNQGWRVAGVPYALRDLSGKETPADV